MYSSRLCSGVITLLLIVLLAVSTASAGSQVTWTKSGLLYSGQGVVHQLQIDCSTQLVLHAPPGATFDIYAIRNYNTFSSCQGGSYIRSHHDRASIGGGETSSLNLDPGTWCVEVYAKQGSGQYRLEGRSSCPVPSHPFPDPGHGNSCPAGQCQPGCSPYKTDVKTGFLNQGQSRTLAYSIPGERSYIEWILTGPCGNEIIPMNMMSAGEVNSMRTRFCGPDFDLYVYRQGNPGTWGWYADYADTGSGSDGYVGVSYPETGAIYYAQIHAKQGGGQYTLTCRSYTCHDEVVMMMKQPEIATMMYTASSVAPPYGGEMRKPFHN
ncbi:MAG: hypothetical protein LUQ50_13715 [Methanospirillum sp.]|uniref:hypothetical protein n=1 Tax=Methanospirillum sp. TaxID=45200 RepID=UPI0023705FA5|nr:hypothetical protein [Methanospirillum sp.]MDD1730113.1 hypothetical protein [Methanospirillum sp.]